MKTAQQAVALVLLLVSALLVSPASAQAPDFRVQVWGDIAADFMARMDTYDSLRKKLEEGLPPLVVTDEPMDIMRAENALARRIRAARAGVGQGAIFTPTIAWEFKKVLLLQLQMNGYIRAVIMDDNPGRFSHDITGRYPKDKSYSTVPGSILAVLPALPDDVYYRFLGPHLVLHDTRANVILDRIRCAIPCRD